MHNATAMNSLSFVDTIPIGNAQNAVGDYHRFLFSAFFIMLSFFLERI